MSETLTTMDNLFMHMMIPTYYEEIKNANSDIMIVVKGGYGDTE